MKTAEKMVSADNPNNVIKHVECCKSTWFGIGITLGIVACITIVYFIGVGLSLGFYMADHPGYNFTSGCPDGRAECGNNEKMGCYLNNLDSCYILGILTALGLILGVPTIILLLWCLALFFRYLFTMCVDCKKSYDVSRTMPDVPVKTPASDKIIELEKDDDIIDLDESGSAESEEDKVIY